MIYLSVNIRPIGGINRFRVMSINRNMVNNRNKSPYKSGAAANTGRAFQRSDGGWKLEREVGVADVGRGRQYGGDVIISAGLK